MTFYAVIIGWLVLSALVICIYKSVLALLISRLKSQGIYPHIGEESNASVVKLRELGYRSLAVQCYSKLHQISARNARKVVLGTDAPCEPWLQVLALLTIAAGTSLLYLSGEFTLAIIVTFIAATAAAKIYIQAMRGSRSIKAGEILK